MKDGIEEYGGTDSNWGSGGDGVWVDTWSNEKVKQPYKMAY
jgi:hypothetical protein